MILRRVTSSLLYSDVGSVHSSTQLSTVAQHTGTRHLPTSQSFSKTALEKVRVAKALWFLLEIDALFKEGGLSYSQVRALTTTACNL